MAGTAFLQPAPSPLSSSARTRQRLICRRPASITRAVLGEQITYRQLEKGVRPSRPPKHHSLPIFGFVLERLLGVATRCDEKHDKYGSVYWSNYMLGNTTYVSDYATITDVMRDPVQFPVADVMPILIELIGQDSVVLLDGAPHAAARDLIAPAFAGPVLEYYFELVREHIEERWESVLARAPTESLKFDTEFRQMYLGIIIEITTGVRWGSSRMDELLENCRLVLSALAMVPFGPAFNRALRGRDDILATLVDCGG